MQAVSLSAHGRPFSRVHLCYAFFVGTRVVILANFGDKHLKTRKTYVHASHFSLVRKRIRKPSSRENFSSFFAEELLLEAS